MHIKIPLQTTDEEYIDIRQSARWYERAYAALQVHPLISDANKALITRFLRDASLGKTLPGRAKKRIGPARLSKHITHLSMLCFATKKNLDTLTQEDMEAFIEALEWQRFPITRWGVRAETDPTVRPKPLSPRYQHDIKLSVRKFYKWLWGNNRVFPPIVEWIDTSKSVKEIASLTEAEIRALILTTNRVVNRAMIQVLFDGGFRIGELMNLRLRHLTYRPIDPESSSHQCFMVRVPFSKTLRRTVVMPMPATTELLHLWLKEHPAKPTLLPDGTLGDCDQNHPLFPVNPNTPRSVLRKAGLRALNKIVYPHLLRHSSATFWCTKLPYFQFCKRFGWTMTSNMPQRYIDREGIDDLESARIYYRHRSQASQTEHIRVESIMRASDDRDRNPRQGLYVPQRAATDMLNNQRRFLIAQSGGTHHDTEVSSNENDAEPGQSHRRNAPGHQGHHHAPEPGQGAGSRRQRFF